MKTFINVAQMKLASLKEGQFVETGGYYTKGDAGQAKYLIVAAQAADGYGDHTLANGTVAVLQVGDSVNALQFGAKGDGIADDQPAIQAAIDTNSRVVGGGLYDVTTLSVKNKTAFSVEEINATVADTTTMILGDTSTPAIRIEDLKMQGVKFTGSSGVGDNFADISTFATSNPLISNIHVGGGRTAIRVGYEPTGTHTVDAIVDNVFAKGCSVFGVEHIESDRTILSNVNVGNDGTQIGSHAIRYTGTIKGTTANVAHGLILRDRLTAGISIQKGAKWNVHGIGVIENTGESGIMAHTTEVIDARSMIPHTVIANTDGDGLDLRNLSHIFFDALVDNVGEKGLRLGGGVDTPNESVNMGRVMVIGAQNGAANVASDFNMIDVIADTCSTAASVFISGNHNMVRVIAKDCGDLTVYITGNSNHVTVVEDGTSVTGLRVDGNNNSVAGLITSIATLNGDGNIIKARMLGSLIDNGARNTAQKASIGEGDAAPTSGTYIRGDKIYDANPNANSFVGWVCVVGGSPGTWKTFGAISA